MTRYALVASALLSLLGVACSDSGSPVVDTPSTAIPSLARVVVLSGRSSPWDMAFVSDGTMFFTERCGGLSVRRTDGSITKLFGPGGTLTAPDFFCAGQSGMHGVALDPAFSTNRRIYVFMASNLSSSPRSNRVVRLDVNAAYTSVSARTDIISDISFKNASTANGGEGSHSGGRIRFGPDGYLYVTTGDNHSGSLPQNPTQLGGKVLRVTSTGAAAPGNNAPAGFDARIYTYGHRNVQGITFREGNNQPFIAEHGPNHSDEVTALVPGGNGGWDPQNRAGLGCPDSYCGYSGDANTMPMTDRTRFPSALIPSWTNTGQSQGMGPATFLNGPQWGAWNGRLAVGIMGGQRLVILNLNAAGIAVEATNAPLPAVRYRSLVQGPDGNLYVATDAGEIWRVTPSGA